MQSQKDLTRYHGELTPRFEELELVDENGRRMNRDMRLRGRGGWDGRESGVKTGERGGEGGREIGVKNGESGGAAGGRGLWCRRGGETICGRWLKLGDDLRWSTTSTGLSQRSVTDNVVGLAGHSNKCLTFDNAVKRCSVEKIQSCEIIFFGLDHRRGIGLRV